MKLVFTKDSVYATTRQSKLLERGRLVKKEVEKVIVKPKEEVKVVEEEKVLPKPVVKHTISKDYYESLIDLKNHYYDLDQVYRQEYENLVRLKASKEQKDALLNKIIDVDNKYKEIVRKIKISDYEASLSEEGPVLKR